jgi:plastocyanin
MDSKQMFTVVVAILFIGSSIAFVINFAAPVNLSVIEITSNGFVPDSLTVSKGTRVEWLNKDTVSHTVIGIGFSSQEIQPGSAVSFVFNQPGTYEYHCSLHGETGQITVLE